MRGRGFLVAFLSAAIALPALAFDRAFPANTKRGTLSSAPYPAIVLDGKPRSLATSARIWNQDNLIETPSAVRASGAAVNYTENEQGEIDRVWILTADEASRKPGK